MLLLLRLRHVTRGLFHLLVLSHLLLLLYNYLTTIPCFYYSGLLNLKTD